MMEYEQIESPLSAFNNIIYQCIAELNKIFDVDVNNTKHHNFIFDNNSIIIYERIKIFFQNNKMNVMLLSPLSENKMYLLKIVSNHFSEITNILYHYLFMMNSLSNNYDVTIGNRYIESIIDDYKNKTIENKYYLIPYKQKIFREVEKDKTLENLYSKFTYLLEFNKNNGKLHYNIIRCTSSDLDESKSIHNIKFLEKDIILNGTVSDLKTFLIKLMQYGEPIGISTKR